MKVLLLGSSNSRNAGGLFNTNQALSQHLYQAGTDVHLLLHDDEHSAADRAVYAPVPLHTYTIKGPTNFAYSPDLRARLNALKPEVIHTQGLWMYFSAVNQAYCAQTHTPYVISPHGMLDPWQLRQSFAKDLKKRVALFAYERAHLQRAACIQALCESEYDAIRAFGLRTPVALIPNGIDLPGARPAAAARPPYPTTRKTLLFLSRLHHKKGLVELLEGWHLTRPEQHDWQLIIAGDTKDVAYKELLATRCEQLGITATVQFVGGQFGEQKDACFRQADAFILPSFSEGLPMAVLEAWSYGLPVLMTAFCNIPEGFTHQAAGAIEPTPASIAAGIGGLIALSAEERAAMGRAGYALVRHKFTWPRVAEATRELYEWVAGRAPQPAFVRLS